MVRALIDPNFMQLDAFFLNMDFDFVPEDS